MIRHITHYVLGLLLLFGTHQALADGTRDVSTVSTKISSLYYNPTDYGSYRNCPVENRIYFKINNAVTEKLYFGFRWVTRGNATAITNMYYRILDANGNQVLAPTLCPTSGAGFITTHAQALIGPVVGSLNAGGYTPISYTASTAGDYFIEIYRSADAGATQIAVGGANGGAAISPFFDFSVATTTQIINGRVWSGKWGLVAGNPGDNYAGAVADTVNPSFYAYTPDSTIVDVNFNNLNPLAYNVAFNAYGSVTGQPDFTISRRSVNSAASPALAGSYKTFLSLPDTNSFVPSSIPSPPIVGQIYGCPGQYFIPYQTFASGDVRILLDLNGVAGFQSGTADRYLFAYGVSAGNNVMMWDGNNGLGAAVTAGGSANVQVTTLRGRTNMPLYDAEWNLFGFTINGVKPSAVPNLRLYWDDSQLTNVTGAGANLNNTTGAGVNNSDTGQVSPGHAWNGTYGTSVITTFPAPSNGGTGSGTPASNDDDYGNVRIINTWFWPLQRSGSASALVIPNCTPAPDFNETFVNVAVTGNVSSNDRVAVGSTYGTPVAAAGNPAATLPVMNTNGTYTFTPTVAGTYNFTVPVCAPSQVPPCPTTLLTIVVTNPAVVNNLPVANTDYAVTTVGTAVTINTLANDRASNPGGSLVPSTVSVTTAPANGTTSVNAATGAITYTPAPGFAGVDTLVYTVCDNSSPALCNTARQIISVQPSGLTNSTFPSDDYTTTKMNTAATGNVLLNDTDPEGNTLTATAATTTVTGKGTLVLLATGAYTFTPVAGFTGPVEFPYTVCDNGTPQACRQATLHVLVTPTYGISGTVFNDVNGLAGTPANTVDGTATNAGGLNAVLVNTTTGNVVATQAIPAGGTYSFTDVEVGNYAVRITTSTATVGALAPAVVLPAGWVSTGEFVGTGAGNDGNINGILPLGLVTASVTNAKFGIEQLPTTTPTATATSQVNPGGTNNSAPITGFSGTDVGPGTVDSIRITIFPTNATSITVGTTTYTSATFPVGGIAVAAPAAVPVQSIVVDPVDGASNVVITYAVVDNAGKQSAATGILTVPFTTISIGGTVFNDANGLLGTPANTVDGTGANAGGLNAVLYNTITNTVVAVQAVPANGVFSFTGRDAGTYSVLITTNTATVGGVPPVVALPAGWVSTGEFFGTAAGNDGTANGILSMGAITASTTNAKFGIEQLPTAITATAPSQANPGGTNNSTAITGFSGTDVAPGTVDSLRITAFPTNVTSITIGATTYTSATFPAGGVTIAAPGGVPGQTIVVDPITGAVNVAISYVVIDNAGKASATAATLTVPFTSASVSGTVFNDANGQLGTPANTIDGTGSNAGGLNALLINGSGNVVATTAVAANGTYSFTDLAAGTYSVLISTTTGTVGSPAPAVTLPLGWTSTAEFLGAGAGNDGNANGILPGLVVATTAVTNANFGIEQLPTAVTATAATQANPGGTNNSAAITGFAGTDVGPGTVDSIRITAFPTNITSITIGAITYTSATFPVGGVAVAAPGGVPSQTITVDPATGPVSVAITYVVVDNAGKSSASATLTVPFTSGGLSGTVFNDTNGQFGTPANTIDGTGSNAGGLNAVLVNGSGNVVATTTVAANGTYSFTDLPAGTYSVRITTATATVGAPAPVVTLPAGWVSTAEFLGAGAGNDGTANGILPGVTIGTSVITNANFGIEQTPTATSATAATQANPGGTNNSAAITGFGGTDVGPGTVDSIRITAFPSNATSITIGATSYTAATFPAGGVSIPSPGGVPSQTIVVDPITGAVNVGIPYVVIDNAGKPSANTATLTVPFTSASVSGTVFNDANGQFGTPANTIDGTGSNAGGLNALLINGSGNVVATTTVAANGTYSFADLAAGTYSVLISTAAGTIGAPAPAVTLPAGWVSTAEFLGTGAGNDGTANGILPGLVVGTTAVTNANFGIEQLPSAVTATAATQANPGGTNNSAAITGFGGTDVGPGTVDSLRITAFPTNVTSITIGATTYTSATFPAGGVTIAAPGGVPGQTILVDPLTGAVNVAISYLVIDNAGKPSASATLTVPFTSAGLSGTVFNDVNGQLGTPANTIDGTGGNAGGLNAVLVNSGGNVVAVAAVASNGAYSFTDIAAGTYSVLITTNSPSVGAVAPAVVLPAGWVSTAEYLGTGAGNDGLVNGVLPGIVIGTSTLNNANFGINQIPTAASSSTAPSQPNPGGTTSVPVLASNFGGSDLSGGVIDSIRITTFPANATSITIGAVTYTPGTFPTGGVSVPTNASGQPSQAISVDPASGAVNVTITYIVVDNAGSPSATSSTLTLPFTGLGISGTVFNDANGLLGTPVNTIDGAGSNAGGLNAVLVDGANNVVATTTVAANGTYSFSGVDGGTYTIRITAATATVGQPAPSVTLPAGWINTAEFLGAGAGNDGTANGQLSVTLGASGLTNANFGIERLPDATNATTTVPLPVLGTIYTLNGQGANPPVPSATDPEDGALGSGGTIVITTLPAFTTLLYNGTPVTLNQVISNFNPSQLQIQVTTSTVGQSGTSFQFTYQDNAGAQDPTPATYTLDWGTPLPVKLAKFTARAEDGSARLDWITYTEENNKGFAIERSADSRGWNQVGFVYSAAENGNSDEELQYTAYDRAPLNGINYYRLKQTDIDGQFTYSEIRQVVFNGNDAITVYPNPATDIVHVTVSDWSKVTEVRLLDIHGKVLFKAKDAVDGVKVGHLAQGTYLLQLGLSNGNIESFKIMKK